MEKKNKPKKKPGPKPETLNLSQSPEEIAKRVMHAGKPPSRRVTRK